MKFIKSFIMIVRAMFDKDIRDMLVESHYRRLLDELGLTFLIDGSTKIANGRIERDGVLIGYVIRPDHLFFYEDGDIEYKLAEFIIKEIRSYDETI